jgi:uncharacterized protein
MEFDTYTVTFLEARPDAPTLDDAEANAVQDAHMAYLTSLHESDRMLIAGPIVTPPERSIRGICLHRLPPDEVLALLAQDPAVRAGLLSVRVFTWMVPKGGMAFSPTHFPRSQAEL